MVLRPPCKHAAQRSASRRCCAGQPEPRASARASAPGPPVCARGALVVMHCPVASGAPAPRPGNTLARGARFGEFG
eukprot:2416058-Prymnesium_polylepis.1